MFLSILFYSLCRCLSDGKYGSSQFLPRHESSAVVLYLQAFRLALENEVMQLQMIAEVTNHTLPEITRNLAVLMSITIHYSIVHSYIIHTHASKSLLCKIFQFSVQSMPFQLTFNRTCMSFKNSFRQCSFFRYPCFHYRCTSTVNLLPGSQIDLMRARRCATSTRKQEGMFLNIGPFCI